MHDGDIIWKPMKPITQSMVHDFPPAFLEPPQPGQAPKRPRGGDDKEMDPIVTRATDEGGPSSSASHLALSGPIDEHT